jgi:hypothetical protein
MKVAFEVGKNYQLPHMDSYRFDNLQEVAPTNQQHKSRYASGAKNHG